VPERATGSPARDVKWWYAPGQLDAPSNTCTRVRAASREVRPVFRQPLFFADGRPRTGLLSLGTQASFVDV
jgi:hypothetical protein